MKTTMHEGPHPCPVCQRNLSASTTGTEHAPEPDNVSVCAYCTNFLVFQKDLQLRRLTTKEFTDLTPAVRAELMRLRHAIETNPPPDK